MNLKVLSVFLGLVVIICGATVYFARSGTPVQPPFGAASGGDFFNPVSINAGLTYRALVSTTSMASSETVTASELRGWAASSFVSFSPGLLAAETVTLPASSTIADIVRTPGDRLQFCIQNATSTAGVYLKFAGGLGTKLLAATSTVATTAGAVQLKTGGVGCFTFIREVATSTAYDIDVLFDPYQ